MRSGRFSTLRASHCQLNQRRGKLSPICVVIWIESYIEREALGAQIEEAFLAHPVGAVLVTI